MIVSYASLDSSFGEAAQINSKKMITLFFWSYSSTMKQYGIHIDFLSKMKGFISVEKHTMLTCLLIIKFIYSSNGDEMNVTLSPECSKIS